MFTHRSVHARIVEGREQGGGWCYLTLEEVPQQGQPEQDTSLHELLPRGLNPHNLLASQASSPSIGYLNNTNHINQKRMVRLNTPMIEVSENLLHTLGYNCLS